MVQYTYSHELFNRNALPIYYFVFLTNFPTLNFLSDCVDQIMAATWLMYRVIVWLAVDTIGITQNDCYHKTLLGNE